MYVSGFILYRLFFIECILSIQQILMSLPGCVITAVLVASSVCGQEDEVLKAKLLATTIFLSGITTFLQVTFGVRLVEYKQLKTHSGRCNGNS